MQKYLDYGVFALCFEPENPQHFNLSLLFPGKVMSESVSLELPKDVVPDSSKAYVTVLGEQLGQGLGWDQRGESGVEAARVGMGGAGRPI